MRLRRACGLLLCLALLPVPALGAGLGEGSGCLGVAVADCIGWLRATMTLDESLLATALAGRHQVDVNGRPLGSGFLTVNARLPGRPDMFVILLHLRPDDTVGRAESNLLGDPLEARTEAGYDDTGFYEVAGRLIGRRCPGLRRLDLYRFFENAVKPRVVVKREDLAGGLFGLHRILSHVVGVPYCGVSFGYTHLFEWRGSSDPRGGRSVKRFSSIELQ